MIRIYKKIYKFNDILKYFNKREWNFKNDNTVRLWQKLSSADKQVFSFDLSSLDWNEFFEKQIIGLRVYLVKDDLSTIPQAKIKHRRLKYLHYTVKTLIQFFILYLIWNMLIVWCPFFN